MLPLRVIQASLQGVLVITVILTALPTPGLPTASLAAVALAVLALAADIEHFATPIASTEFPLTGASRKCWTGPCAKNGRRA